MNKETLVVKEVVETTDFLDEIFCFLRKKNPATPDREFNISVYINKILLAYKMFQDENISDELIQFNTTEVRSIIYIKDDNTGDFLGVRINFQTMFIRDMWKTLQPKISHLHPNTKIDYAMVGIRGSIELERICEKILINLRQIYGGILQRMASSKKQLEQLQLNLTTLNEEVKQLKQQLKLKSQHAENIEKENKLINNKLLEAICLGENWKKKAEDCVLSTAEELKIQTKVTEKMEEFKKKHLNEVENRKNEIKILKTENEDYQTSITFLIDVVTKLSIRRSTPYVPNQPKIILPSPPKHKPKQKTEVDDLLEEELQTLMTEND